MKKLFYEKPSFNQYGTMKDITLGSGGSGADASGRGRNK